jgi:hypothetical protein
MIRLIVGLVELKALEAELNETFDKIKDIVKIEYKYRSKRGGGVAIVHTKNISSQRINHLDHYLEEFVGLKCFLGNFELFIGCWYNPPKKHLNTNFLIDIELSHKNFLIFGDLNAKSIELKNKKNNKSG